MKTESETQSCSRRAFIKKSSFAAVSGLTILKRETAFGTQANSMIQAGIIGTGGRGRHDGRLLVNTGRARIVALSDYFDFQVNEAAGEFGVDPSRCFPGMDGYTKLLALSEVDAVVLTAPPYFRPEQFRAAVQAGKHVYAEKPVAVDPWGCRHFLETGRMAEQKKLTVVGGLQMRYESGRREIARKISEGAIGEPVIGHSTRMGGDLWRRERPASFSERDHQVRHWLYYLWAGGDFIVEMHVHNLDIFNWFTGMLPLAAYGQGGRTVRTDVGDIYDHLNVLYEYPRGFHLSHSGSQISTGYSEQSAQILGSKGSFDSKKGLITKDSELGQPGETRNADQVAMQEMVASVDGNGPYLNNSEYVATSTFTAILGREAAYRKERVTWRELWESNRRIEMPV